MNYHSSVRKSPETSSFINPSCWKHAEGRDLESYIVCVPPTLGLCQVQVYIFSVSEQLNHLEALELVEVGQHTPEGQRQRAVPFSRRMEGELRQPREGRRGSN